MQQWKAGAHCRIAALPHCLIAPLPHSLECRAVSGFEEQQGTLACDGIPLREIAASTGTPVHVYSRDVIAGRYGALDRAFANWPHVFHYALKANSTLGVVKLMRELGAAADANSGGEIEVALRAGYAPGDIVFTGVGKTPAELERAIGLGVRAINVESPGEIARIDAMARARGSRARVALRINPDVDAESHPHVSTGRHENKFGVTVDVARDMVRGLPGWPAISLVGLHVHIGSQITKPAPITRATELVAGLASELVAQGVALEHVDLGGGLGIAYSPGTPVVTAEEYAHAVLPAMQRCGLPLLLEPGRWIVGPAGVLVAAVVDLKRRASGGWFVVVDAGMTDCLRPALYGAWHGIDAVTPRPGPLASCDVVGPICETADTLGSDRQLPPVEVGDLLAIRDTGAYGAVMASNYNRRPMAAEVLVANGRWDLVRRRQTVDDLLRWET
jgi:diaminopimelate decarboxylase